MGAFDFQTAGPQNMFVLSDFDGGPFVARTREGYSTDRPIFTDSFDSNSVATDTVDADTFDAD